MSKQGGRVTIIDTESRGGDGSKVQKRCTGGSRRWREKEGAESFGKTEFPDESPFSLREDIERFWRHYRYND